MKNIIPILTGLCLLVAMPGSAADKDKPEKPAKEAKAEQAERSEAEGQAEEESYYEQLKKLVQSLMDSGKEATEKGKEMSAEAKEWVRSDFNKIGDWEYKQVVIKVAELSDMGKRLNQLGEDRWDCFWVHQQGQDIHLLLKRPAISYLQKIGRLDLIKLIPTGGDKE